jgi:phage N-6-adenine-methyltransferase
MLQLVRHDEDAAQIGALYAKAKRSATDSLKYLIEAGQQLQAKKDSMLHGAWLPWLKANARTLNFDSRSTASRLMKIADKCCVNATFDEAEAAEKLRNFWGNEPDEDDAESRGPKPYTGDDEWYTPAEHIKRVRKVLGGIDLDPASNDQAQKIVRAKRFFTKADDALTQDWLGRVWLNPPYSKGLLAQFVDKLLLEIKNKNTTAAIALLNNFTDADWFQQACSICTAVPAR